MESGDGVRSGAILTDLSQIFDCTDHELLKAKLDIQCFDKNSSYFNNLNLKGWKQRTKVNFSYSAFAEIFFGVPWGTTLGPLLSAFTSLTSFLKKVTLMLLIMLMAMHRMPLYQTLIISLLNFRKTQEGFLDGFIRKTQYQTLKRVI